VDEPIEVTPRSAQGSQPAVAWSGRGWSLLFQSDPGSAFRLHHATVDPEVQRVESFGEVRGGTWVQGHEWAVGRHAVVTSPIFRSENVRFGAVDARGTLAWSWTELPAEDGHGDVARQALGGLWAVITREGGRHMLRGFRDGSATIVHSVDAPLDGAHLRVEGMASRVAAVWVGDRRLWMQSVVMGEGPLDDRMDLGETSPSTDSSLRTGRLRDSVLVTHVSRDLAWLTTANPFDGSHTRVAFGPGRVGDRPIGVVGVDKHGVIGACVPTGPGPHGGASGRAAEGVAFYLLAADGDRLAGPIQVVDELFNIGGCAVAFHVDSFIVVWWRASGTREYNSLWARRLHTQLDR